MQTRMRALIYVTLFVTTHPSLQFSHLSEMTLKSPVLTPMQLETTEPLLKTPTKNHRRALVPFLVALLPAILLKASSVAPSFRPLTPCALLKLLTGAMV